MMRRAVLGILTLGLAGLSLWAALTPMAFWMGASQYQYRDAQVMAYSLAASDYEVMAECSYLSSVNAYAWGLNQDLPAPYSEADMVLFGAFRGAVLTHRFTPRAGLTDQVQWVPIPAPAMSVSGRTVTLSWTLPTLEAVDHWDLLVDGVAQALPLQPHAVTLAPGTHTFALRAVLVGSPQTHQATGNAAKVVLK